LDDEAVRLLEQYRWPGNIRQLRNLAEQMSVIETSRLVGKDVLKAYLPQVDASNLPALANTRLSDDGVSNSDFAKEREALYKLLFEMRAEINALKNAMSAGEGIYEGIQQAYPKITGDLNSSDGQVTFVKQEQYEDFNEDENTIEIENLSLVDKEVELIKKALDKSKGKRKKAAKELGISERTLYRKIKQYNLE